MGRKITNKYQNDMVKDAVVRLYESQARFKQVEDAYKEERKRLQQDILKYMGQHGLCSFNFLAQQGVFANDNRNLKIMGITPKKVNFDVEKMEELFGKEVLKEVVVKHYHITDMPGLVEYLKTCGVNPKKFKSFIEVEKEVDVRAVNRLGDVGVIKKEELAGCCNVIEGESYVKIQVID